MTDKEVAKLLRKYGQHCTNNSNKCTNEKKCDCRVCRKSKELVRVLQNDNIDFIKGYLSYTFGELMNTEFDLDYYKAILDGSWPSSVRILEEALEKAKNHPNREKGKNEKDY